MTTARRTLDRMTCPTCGRQVAFRLIHPALDYGRRSPGIRKPVRHKRQMRCEDGGCCVHISDDWCPAGEP